MRARKLYTLKKSLHTPTIVDAGMVGSTRTMFCIKSFAICSTVIDKICADMLEEAESTSEGALCRDNPNRIEDRRPYRLELDVVGIQLLYTSF